MTDAPERPPGGRGRGRHRVRSAALTLGLVGGVATLGTVAAARSAPAGPCAVSDTCPDVAPSIVPADAGYDGRFAFVRVRFGEGGAARGFGGWGRRGGGGPVWAHDYPRAETNFLKILSETTLVGTDLEGQIILGLDDPELYRHPVAYIVEVGYWRPTEEEAAALRTYLLKGGFLIVDDFRGPDLDNFERQLRRVLPDARLLDVPDDHEVFDAFFHIEDPHALAPPTYPQYRPRYLGVFEDNDPSRRLMMIVNYNQDIAEYWEFSDYGYFPIDLSNDAYKFGVNYVIYAHTH